MQEGKGEYRGGNRGGYARVHVCQVNDNTNGTVSIALDDDPWNAQLKTGAYPDWIEAAVNGCRYAIKTACATWGSWEVRRIVGTDADTSNEFVVIAAARAIWNCCDFRATQLDVDELTKHAHAFRFDYPNRRSTEGK